MTAEPRLSGAGAAGPPAASVARSAAGVRHATTSPPAWASWAPPLDPPAPGGLAADDAAQIAEAWWDDDPHLAAALMWEAYAATLPPAAPVSQVATGSQSVTYSPASPPGEYGLAIGRAEWHRSFCTLATVPLVAAQTP
jgi:hypothetical protein